MKKLRKIVITMMAVLMLIGGIAGASTQEVDAKAKTKYIVTTASTHITVGTKITLKMKGSSKNKYKIQLKIGKGKRKTKRKYSKKKTYSYTPKKAGTYTFYVKGKRKGRKVTTKRVVVYVTKKKTTNTTTKKTTTTTSKTHTHKFRTPTHASDGKLWIYKGHWGYTDADMSRLAIEAKVTGGAPAWAATYSWTECEHEGCHAQQLYYYELGESEEWHI